MLNMPRRKKIDRITWEVLPLSVLESDKKGQEG